jgi:ABC-type amino acid transport substrate-binding protein
MNQTNRTVWAAVGVIVIGGLAGFGGAKLGGGGGSANASISSPLATPYSFINQIKSSGKLTVGCATSPPTIVIHGDGSCTGPDLIPAQELAKDLNVQFQTVDTTWQNIVTGLEAGKYDFATDLDATAQRALAIQYTSAIWSYPGVFVVPANSPFQTSAAILSSGNSSVAQGSAEDLALEAVNPAPQETKLPDWPHAFLALQSGRVNAEFTDLGDAEVQVEQDKSMKIVIPNPPIFVHDVDYGVPSTVDPASLQAIDILIQNDVAAGVIDRAFTAAGYVANPCALGNMLVATSAAACSAASSA